MRPDLLLKVTDVVGGVIDDSCALLDEVSRLTALAELKVVGAWLRGKKTSILASATQNPLVFAALSTLAPEKAEKFASEIWRVGLVRTILQTATGRLQRYTAVKFP